MNKESEKIKFENTKKRILKVATKLFAKNGFDGTSIRDICKNAGINVSMVSYYWGGKKELYDGIIKNLFERQTDFAKSFLNFDEDPYNMSFEKRLELLKLIANKMIDFFYSNISNDMVVFIFRAQRDKSYTFSTPLFQYLKKLFGSIMNKNENDKEVIFKMLFFISQINSPRIMPALSLSQLGKENFNLEDIDIIRKNVVLYINQMVKE